MKLKVINIDGKKVNDIEISDKIFSLKPNKIKSFENENCENKTKRRYQRFYF
jgi:ribosomal protein L4